MLRRQLLGVALWMAAGAVAATPQTPTTAQITVERIFASAEFQSDLIDVRWTDDGRAFTALAVEPSGRTSLYRVDARSGASERVVNGADLVTPDGRPILMQDYAFSPDGSRLLVYTDVQPIWRYSTRGTYYVWDLEAERLTPISSESGGQQFAKFAPDGGRVAFVREGDLWLTDLATGEERALTTDGGDTILNGVADWVYEEELELYDAFRWSPDGRRIAYWRFDQRPIRVFHLVNELPIYPELVPIRYPKAGTDNSRVRAGVLDLESGETTWIDLDPGQAGYIARMDFAGSPDTVWIQRLNRHQSRMDLLLADVRTGGTRTVLTETDEAWLELDEPIWIEGGSRFVYQSERDGQMHLYLYRRDGRRIRQLTSGDWAVEDVWGVDEERGRVYFSSTLEGPLERPLHRVSLDGGRPQKISAKSGTHEVNFDPTFRLYVDTYSTAEMPPVQTLHSSDGDSIRTIAENARIRRNVREAGIERPEFLRVPSAEDGVELNAYLIRPPDFEPGREYPLLLYVYGGPGSQTVRDAWGGERFLWHQMLAQRGFLVASVDNRGTGGRGARFKKQVYLRLGQLETADQIAAARHFTLQPYVDGERIAIWGWSYGGYLSALSILRGADVFRAAIAVAPVSDWRFYDTIYTERYMRTPAENPTGYRLGSALTFAEDLRGRLLLVHGTGDDNVHPQHTIHLVEALESANRQFDLRLYPNLAHAIAGPVARVNLFTMMTRLLEEELQVRSESVVGSW